MRAVLLATGANAAGRTMGLSLPNGAAQAALLRQAMAEAGVAPERIAYFEAHGTGTAAGDPIEAAALGEAIGRHRTRAPLPVGSAKTNIGHLEPASGMAGLLKAMLVLEHGRIPPSLHFDAPNPAIDFAALGLRVPTAAEPLAATRRRGRVVGVNSFGFGGTNATALLAAAPPRPAAAAADAARSADLPPLLLSAASAAGARRRWRRAGKPRSPPRPSALPALLRGAARHRDPCRTAWRCAAAAGAELVGALAAWRAGAEAPPPAGRGRAARRPARRLRVQRQRRALGRHGRRTRWPPTPPSAPASPRPTPRSPRISAGRSRRRWPPASPAAALAATDRAQPLLFAVQHGIVAALAARGHPPRPLPRPFRRRGRRRRRRRACSTSPTPRG